MKIKDAVAVVTGGVSGLGEATVRMLIEHGAQVVAMDIDEEKGQSLSIELGDGHFIYQKTDVSDEESVKSALKVALDRFGKISLCINCAGIVYGAKTLGKDGPHSLLTFEKVIRINLIGTFNVLRLTSEIMCLNAPNEDGERGVIINTASISAFDGQIGQAAYAASKGGIVSMTLPIARDLSRSGIRCMAIAPGLFHTPLFDSLPSETYDSLCAQVPFPPRLGRPQEYAALVQSIITNPMLNGEVIRLDGALRMSPK